MGLDKYKQAVLEEYNSTNNNIAVKACPGSGKTYLLKQISKHTPQNKKQLFLAFNKSIVNEISEELPEHVDVSTVHSKCYKVLRDNTDFRAKINDNKGFVLGKKYLNLDHVKLTDLEAKKAKNKKAALEKKRNLYLFSLQQISHLIRLNLTPLEEEDIGLLCTSYGVYFDEDMFSDIVKLMVAWNNHDITKKDSIIDFTDMLYLTHLLVDKNKFPKYNVVLIDEAQDISLIHRELMLNFKHNRGRFVAVGDEKQTIYGFIGATLQSFIQLQQLPKTTVFPLDVTYRCSRKVVDEANTVFKGLENLPTAKGGEVRNRSFVDAESGDYILCRNNLPLVAAMVKLIEVNKKCFILGRDLGENLLKITSKIDEVYELKNILYDKAEELENKGIKTPEKTPAYLDLKEKCSIIEILDKTFGSINEVDKNINKIFKKDKSDGIMLSTIHKSKGLEAKNVYIISHFENEPLMPSKYATTENELYAEKCLQYVAITRAKENVYYSQI